MHLRVTVKVNGCNILRTDNSRCF